MSPRVCLLLFLILPVFAKRSGGGSHTYPSSGGLSGNTGHSSPYGTHSSSPSRTQAAIYPHSTGLSGNNNSPRGNTNTNTYVHKEVHHHHYAPPQQINYGSGYHPVYHGSPPVYVYEYRNSGSRFDTLLTGLALYNLGRMSAHSNDHYYDSRREYRGNPGETCKLAISKSNGEYEETRIDCKLMSSFIWEAEQTQPNKVASTNTVTTVTKIENNSNNSNNSTVTYTTVQNTTVVDALQVKGPSIQVTPGMNCYMIRISRYSSVLKKKVDCGLLQAYAQSSFNSSWRNFPTFTILTTFFAYCVN